MILIHLVLFVILTISLVKGSDYFIEAAARIAKYLGVSELIIGLTIVAWGTSLPELGASVMAAFSGSPVIAMGNIIGSNIANIGLILGLSATLVALKTNRDMFTRDCAILLGITSIFYFLTSDGVIGWKGGIILLAIMIAYTAFLFKFKPKFRNMYRFRDYFAHSYRFQQIRNLGAYRNLFDKSLRQETYDKLVDDSLNLNSYKRFAGSGYSRIKVGLARELTMLVISGFVIFFSAKYLIPSAIEIATYLGISKMVAGLVLIAIGTSLPELAVSISAIRKGFGNILIGNIIGSNIANMALIGGVSALIAPLPASAATLSFTMPFMFLITLFLVVFVRSGFEVKRIEGAALFILYIAFLINLMKLAM